MGVNSGNRHDMTAKKRGRETGRGFERLRGRIVKS